MKKKIREIVELIKKYLFFNSVFSFFVVPSGYSAQQWRRSQGASQETTLQV